MTELELYHKLNLHPDTIAALMNFEPSKEQEERLRAAIPLGEDTIKAVAGAEENPELLVLKLYLRWAPEALRFYQEKGIPEELFWHNMHDFYLWSEDYRLKTGKHGVTEWYWLSTAITPEVFRLGRLQYQIFKLHTDAPLKGTILPAGTEVLTVHIPAGEPLDPQAVLESMKRAPGFFKQYFGKEFTVYHCESWLLSPVLLELMSPDSAIIKFQNLYQVYATDPFRQAEERVFGFITDDPSLYPEKTSLQRKMKQYLLSGKPVPEGIGVGYFADLP